MQLLKGSRKSFLAQLESSSMPLTSQDNQRLSKLLFNKCLLITGAGGSVGKKIVLAALSYSPSKIILLENNEYALYQLQIELEGLVTKSGSKVELIFSLASVCDPAVLEKLDKDHGINLIYHTASFKHVPLLEENIFAAISNNIFGSLNIVKLAQSSKSIEHAVLISTDKAVNASSIMGKTKRVSELLFQAAHEASVKQAVFTTVRFGNVYGSSGSVVERFEKLLSLKQNLTVTSENMTRYFMNIYDAANLTLLSTNFDSSHGLVIFDMGKPISILALAKQMIVDFGLVLKDKENPEGDIAIEIIGNRAGEKVREELSFSREVIDTDHPRIKLVKEPKVNWNEMIARVDALKSASISRDESKLKTLLDISQRSI